ncbi:glycosyltransferase family 2 protein [Aeromonas veronii]|uniref:glycosyltransferase family 2 protein n=1 Tax=Aeromonas veronii TaxID=654 RepID=UPI00300461AE
MIDFNKKINDVVTVAVITYHSAATVLETLDSILTQSYDSKNIELIISDDGSKDNTVQMIVNWLSQHQASFYCVRFFANQVNGGISKNCNVAWKAATSKWIKTIAGDDLLCNTCIEENMLFINNRPDVEVLFSKMNHFKDGSLDVVVDVTPHKEKISLFELSADEQFRALIKMSFNVAPTSFIKKEILQSVGFCCEEYFYIEDLPLWLKMTRYGHKLCFMDKVTVYYRLSDSLSNSLSRLININFIEQVHLVHKKEIWPYLRMHEKWRVYDKYVEYYSWLVPYKIFNNKRNIVSLSLHYIISCFRPTSLSKIINRFK